MALPELPAVVVFKDGGHFVYDGKLTVFSRLCLIEHRVVQLDSRNAQQRCATAEFSQACCSPSHLGFPHGIMVLRRLVTKPRGLGLTLCVVAAAMFGGLGRLA